MRYYETIYIIDPNLENSVVENNEPDWSRTGKTKAKIINHRAGGKKNCISNC